MALNTPTVFNASLNFRLNWEGNFRSLEEGAENSLRNPAIMASSADEVAGKLRADPETGEAIPRRLWEGARRRCRAGCDRDIRTVPGYAGQPLRPMACGRSVMRSRRTSCPAIRFSNRSAASRAIKASMWAAICFSGTAFSIRWARRSRVLLRVPSLRNVATTAPYFHDGSASTLAGGGQGDGHRPARPRADRSANRRHRRLPQHADRHLPGSVVRPAAAAPGAAQRRP